jgi:hypothetical protein
MFVPVPLVTQQANQKPLRKTNNPKINQTVHAFHGDSKEIRVRLGFLPECKRQPGGTTQATSMGLGHPPSSFRPSPPFFSLQIPYSVGHLFLSILFMADSTHE